MDLNKDIDLQVLYGFCVTPNNYTGEYRKEFSSAWQYIDNLEFTKALELFLSLAEKEDKDAQMNVGVIYESYPPVQNLVESKFWYTKAVDNNSIEALAFLGNQYGKLGDFEKEFELLSESVSHNNYYGFYNLATAYEEGRGVTKDINKAITLMEKSIKHTPKHLMHPGNPFFSLGRYYFELNDYKRMNKYFEKSYKADKLISWMILEFYLSRAHEMPESELAKIEYWELEARKVFSNKKIDNLLYEYSAPIPTFEEFKAPIESNKNCFIATAVYGSPYASEVDMLRSFRDKTLLSSDIGKYMVKIYYQVSPRIANVVEKSPLLKKSILLFFLSPLIVYLKKKGIYNNR